MQATTAEIAFDRIGTGATEWAAALQPTHKALAGDEASVFVEEINARGIIDLEDDIQQLASRALEQNVFFSADFLLAASRHFRAGSAPRFLVVWTVPSASHGRRLIGLLPLKTHDSQMLGRTAHVWRHPYAAFGAPLLDSAHATAALNAVLDHLAQSPSAPTALALDTLDRTGPMMNLLSQVVAARGGQMATIATYARASLTSASGAGEKTKNDKELRRLRRRLGEQGTLTFSLATTYEEIRSATEEFLLLEASGWKGRAGSALVQETDSANFTRIMLWSAARRDQVRIARLDLDGRMIAAVVILTASDTAFLWKMAYSEDLARYSPGVLLIQSVSDWVRETGMYQLVDSCAKAGHGMIESLWSERRDLCDVMVATGTAKTPGFLAAVAQERFRRNLRQRVKSLYHRLRGKAAA